jgi:hypothetical protein
MSGTPGWAPTCSGSYLFWLLLTAALLTMALLTMALLAMALCAMCYGAMCYVLWPA